MLVALALTGGAGQAGDGLKGELYVVGLHDSERIERVDFNYDGQNFKVARSRKTHNLRGAGEVQRRLDSLRSPKSARPRRQIRRVTSYAAGTFGLPEGSGGATLRIELESWEDVPHRPAAADLPPIGGVLTGDDISLSHVAVEADGSAYYFGEDGEDGGTFGEIDLDTNATTRLLEGLPPAEDVVDDPLNGELIVIGEGEIAQIQPAPVAHIVSRHKVAPGEALESGAVDGDGHLFVRRGDGEIVFVDYSASGRIGAAGNFTAAARVGLPLDAARQRAARDESWQESVPWLEVLAGLAATLALILVTLFFRARKVRRARAAASGRKNKFGGSGGEIVYSRWPEDWSELKRLVASMSAVERSELGGRLERNPRMLDDARALIRWPVEGGMSELRGGPAFGAALAGFATGRRRVEWQSDAGAREDGLALRIAHQLGQGADENWSRVIVEVSLGGAFQALAEEAAAVAAGVAENRALAPALTRKQKKGRKPRRSVVEAAAELGQFDIRGMFERVARRLVDEGAATRLELDAADGLRMSGDEKTVGGALEGVLRASLSAEHQEDAAPPSLAVMAYEEKGEIHFIALRAGVAGSGDGDAHLTGAALKEANKSAAREGGRAWVEPGEEGQVCRFTLGGKKGSKSARRRAKRRLGWRPAQPKAVWNMRSEGGDSSRY